MRKEGTITQKKKEQVDKIYEFIKSYYAENLTVPTIREIQCEFNFSSTSIVWFSLAHLERMGKIEKVGKTYKVLSAKISFDD